MRIAFQGSPGDESETAANRAWPQATTHCVKRFEDVLTTVAKGQASHGILPVENSIDGSIHRNYDLLLEYDLPIVAETKLRVTHSLVARAGTSLAAIRKILAAPHALAQCEQFVRDLPDVEIVATFEPGSGVQLIREGNLDNTAAIAPAQAGDTPGLTVLQAGIQDYPDNVTRFILVSRNPTPLAKADKTMLAFALQNQPGALFKALSVFALRDVDVMRIESRPARDQPWDDVFYADLGAGREEIRCARAIVHLAESVRWVKTLGSFARWVEPSLDHVLGEGTRQSSQ
jgi:prephenate dehydratase